MILQDFSFFGGGGMGGGGGGQILKVVLLHHFGNANFHRSSIEKVSQEEATVVIYSTNTKLCKDQDCLSSILWCTVYAETYPCEVLLQISPQPHP